MNYCYKCHTLCKGNVCHRCGNEKLRQPTEEDFCYLVTVNDTFGKMLMQSLKNEGIECAYIPVGDGVRSHMALTLGCYEIYVQYNRYSDAVEIYDFYMENYSPDKLKEKILKNVNKWHFENEKAERKIRKKLKLKKEDDILAFIKEKVENAESVSDQGLMVNNEHGLMVKSSKLYIWFTAETFQIDV